ncbi:MAG: hypothetical protein K8U57_12350 [Planctomycetes bacterium]|nr:hypothetical protein [Planctomycetota bacterium]
MNSRRLPLVVLAIALGGGIGCRHFGPRSIVADRIPYNEAIAHSWKEQTLLNIVKMRYTVTPFFVDVPQITSGYTFQGTAGANGGIIPPVNPLASFSQQLTAGLNLQGAYQDRPTISYTPQTGSQFIRNLTTPINPGTVLFLLQSGYPADVIFNLMVDSINGIKNRTSSGGQLRPADPEFAQVTQSLRKAQMAGHVGIRVQMDKEKKETVAFFFHDKDADPELAKELAVVRKALKIDPNQTDFRVTFGATAASPQEIAILSRSVLRVLQELSTFVDVPVDHLARGIAPPLHDVGTDTPLFQVCSGCKKPCDSFVTVCYEGRWFWIEKNDIISKRTLGQILVLLALADTGAKENLPVITIQAN